jgi:hypothetical protein
VRRRGCLIGIGGVMLALVLCCVLGWFVFLPRFHDAVEREMTTLLSTEVADAIVAQVPDGASVDPGEYRISLAELQRRASGGSDNLQVEGVEIRGEGDELVLGFSAGNAGAEYRFTPVATSDGRLELTNMRGEGGVVQQLLAPEALGGAVENSVNTYLDANNLVLTDVYLEGDELVLVLGEV